ncbi:hypothetical protein OAI76_00445 [Alphaproteobacteria bacterium]|nr:hypothetical protein [Alphaproteobacteria bacterium]
MENKLLELKSKLCKTYFSIINASLKTEIYIEELCVKSKVSIEDAQKVLPKMQKDYKIFFLTMLSLKLDQETLNEFKEEIHHDNVSTIYEKTLEGITLRFEKYLPFRPALKILSEGLDLRAKNFLGLLESNHFFMLGLLDIVESNKNQCTKILKSIALNLVFLKTTDIFLKEENLNIDSTIRYLDKYLHEIEDIGYMIGIFKK